MVVCCVVGCSLKADHKIPGVRFYCFPSRPWESEIRKRWLNAIRRANPDGSPWEPHKSSRVCSRHFVNGIRSRNPHSPGFLPSIFPEVYRRNRNDEEVRKKTDGDNRIRVTPSIDSSRLASPALKKKGGLGTRVEGPEAEGGTNRCDAVRQGESVLPAPCVGLAVPRIGASTVPCAAWLETTDSPHDSDSTPSAALSEIVDKPSPAVRPKIRRLPDDTDPQNEPNDIQVLDAKENKVKFLELELTKAHHDAEELRQQLADSSFVIAKLEKKVNSLNSEKSAFRKEGQNYQKQLKAANSKIKKLENQVKLQGAEINNYKKKIRKDANLEAELKTAKLVIKQLEDQGNLLNSERDRKSHQQGKKDKKEVGAPRSAQIGGRES